MKPSERIAELTQKINTEELENHRREHPESTAALVQFDPSPCAIVAYLDEVHGPEPGVPDAAREETRGEGEARVTINGSSLTDEQVTVIGVSVGFLLAALSGPLTREELGQNADEYEKRLREVEAMLT